MSSLELKTKMMLVSTSNSFNPIRVMPIGTFQICNGVRRIYEKRSGSDWFMVANGQALRVGGTKQPQGVTPLLCFR